MMMKTIENKGMKKGGKKRKNKLANKTSLHDCKQARL